MNPPAASPPEVKVRAFRFSPALPRTPAFTAGDRFMDELYLES
jgi:hypothetical protein